MRGEVRIWRKRGGAEALALYPLSSQEAAPLLGCTLPRDLLGAPVLLFLHPEDRPLMLAIPQERVSFLSSDCTSSCLGLP